MVNSQWSMAIDVLANAQCSMAIDAGVRAWGTAACPCDLQQQFLSEVGDEPTPSPGSADATRRRHARVSRARLDLRRAACAPRADHRPQDYAPGRFRSVH